MWCSVCRHGPAIVRVDIKSYGPSTDVSRIHKDLSKGEKKPCAGDGLLHAIPRSETGCVIGGDAAEFSVRPSGAWLD